MSKEKFDDIDINEYREALENAGEQEEMVVDLETENGEIVTCRVVDDFMFEDNQYFLVEAPEGDNVYLFKQTGEELIVPEEEEFDRVCHYYETELAE